MAQIFVTGGSGFLGGSLIQRLCAQGDTVRALARSETAAAKVKEAGAEPVMGDLDDTAVMQAAMAGCSVVYHCAAAVALWGPPDYFHRVNVQGTENVLAAARGAGVPCLVHVSTEAVLIGGPPLINVDETMPYPEKPLGLYPLTKGLAEKRVLAANSPELRTVIVRPRFIWGKGDTVLLPSLIELVQQGRFLWFDEGRPLTSTCHVANVCEGMLLAADRGQGGEIYFLTDGETVTVRQFLTALMQTQGVTPGDRSISLGLARTLARASEMMWRWLPLPGGPPLTQTAVHLMGQEVTVNDAKARHQLGYVGQMTHEAGLAEMRA